MPKTQEIKIDEVIKEWKSKKRKMGCVAATAWFCARIKTFKPERLRRYLSDGEFYEHVLVTDGVIRIDLVPYADKPKP